MVEKTGVLALRIGERDLSELKKLARMEHLSVAALVSNVLKSYIDWDYMAAKVGMIPLQKEVIKEIFDNIPDEVLEGIGARAAERFVGHMLLMTGEATLDSCIEITRKRVEKSGFYMSKLQDGGIQLTIHHKMGRKWSLFFGTYHERAIQKLGYETELDLLDDLWRITIKTA